VVGIGMRMSDESAAEGTYKPSDVIEFDLCSGALRRWFPRIASYLSLVEMTLRMVCRAGLLRPSVVHCHDYWALPAGWLLAILGKAQLVYDAHELESERNGLSRRGSWLCLLIERWCWGRIALLVSVGPSILSWYQQNLGPKRSVLVLNAPVVAPCSSGQPISRTRNFGERGYFHDRFDVPAGTPMFIYLGGMVYGRGIERVLEVFRRSSVRSHVVFVGYSDKVGVGKHAALFPNIHLHPAVPHEQVVQLVREADCGLCLIEDVSMSDRLCLPNKLFEYAFAGVPVLASRLPEIARVVGEYGLGICCDNDADSIEAAVRKIEREGIEASRSDLTDLSWETQSKRLQQAYLSLLSGRGLSPASKIGRC